MGTPKAAFNPTAAAISDRQKISFGAVETSSIHSDCCDCQILPESPTPGAKVNCQLVCRNWAKLKWLPYLPVAHFKTPSLQGIQASPRFHSIVLQIKPKITSIADSKSSDLLIAGVAFSSNVVSISTWRRSAISWCN